MTAVTWVELWAGILIFTGVAMMWGVTDVEVGAIILVAMAAFLAYNLGWLVPSVAAGGFAAALALLFILAVIKYIRKKEDRIS
ncbi:MAG: hypothetical protein PHV83_08205 [Bacteroidales bacterium]|nr:hypothetical protein [Bacteroidales bacterium]